MASEINVSKVIKLQESIKVQLKKLIQQAILNGMTKEDADMEAKALINQFLKENKDVKLKYKDLYKTWTKLLYGNYAQMYKISLNSFNKELKKDKESEQINNAIKEVYKSDKVKKQSYVFTSNQEFDENNLNLTSTPNLKFIRTSAEYGYTQMQIDNYVEKVEKTMDKLAQINFVSVNSAVQEYHFEIKLKWKFDTKICLMI